MSSPSSSDHIAIQNILARYCQALDTKNLDLLDKVFAEDVAADYPFNSDLKGVEAIKTAIQNRLGLIRTHHNLTTQSITFNTEGTAAEAATHFIAVHFGKGPHAGKVLTAYGIYKDELVVDRRSYDNEGVPNASGIWRIRKRKVVFVSRIGDENIMK